MRGPRWTRLLKAIDEVNRVEIAAVEQEHDIRFLDIAGPVFAVYAINVRGLFVGDDGRYWVDAALWRESSRGEFSGFTEWALDELAGRGLGFDLDVVTLERGHHSASMVAVDDLADLCGLGPAAVVASGWARSWRSFPWLSDGQAVALREAGVPGEPGLFETGPVPPDSRRHLSVVRADPQYEAALDVERLLHARGELHRSRFPHGAFPGLPAGEEVGDELAGSGVGDDRSTPA